MSLHILECLRCLDGLRQICRHLGFRCIGLTGGFFHRRKKLFLRFFILATFLTFFDVFYFAQRFLF